MIRQRRAPGRRVERGFTMIELLIVVAIIAIVAAFAVPRLLRARMSANEAAAIGTVKAIATAELVYSKSCGGGGYATTLPALSAAPGGGAPFLSPDMTTAAAIGKAGYTFVLAASAAGVAGPNDCAGVATETAYYITAVPTSFGYTGTRSFATSGLPIIWEIDAAAAPTEPLGPPARPVQ